MKNVAFTLIIAFILTSVVSAQEIQLKSELSRKHTLSEIMATVDQYYEGKPEGWRGYTGSAPKLKQWYRWADFMSYRTDAQGRFVNNSKATFEATEKMSAMTAPRDINSHWYFNGPNSSTGGVGRADRITFHPTLPNTLYVGTPAGGLWRSDNNGDDWYSLSDHIPSTGISGIVVNWTNPNQVYILTGDGDSNTSGLVDDHDYMRESVGVLKSSNNGVTWYATGEMSPDTSFVGYKLIQSHTDPNVLFAATSNGIYKTVNAGTSWYKVAINRHFDIEMHPTNSSIVYATGAVTFYVSTDGGESFNNISNYDVPFTSTQRLEISVTPDFPNCVYLLGGGVPDTAEFSGIYRSFDSGSNFTQMATTPNILGYGAGTGSAHQARYDLCMDVSSTDYEAIVTGGVYVWRSSNGGASFTQAATSGSHADIHDVKYNPVTGDLFAATDGGMYRSSDNGSSWETINTGMGTMQIYNVGRHPDNISNLIIGTQDNGLKLRQASSNFVHVYGGDGFDGAWAAGRDTIYATRNKNVYRFTNNASDVKNINEDIPLNFFGHVETHNTNPDMVFVGKKDVWRSDDAGATWDNLGVSGYWDVEMCPSNSNRIYAAGSENLYFGPGGLWRSNNLGDDWISLHDKPGFPHDSVFNRVADIGVRPTNSLNVWVTFGGYNDTLKVLKSTNGGLSWENVSYSLPNVPVNAIGIDAENGAYVGTDIGVFYMGPNMDDWIPFSNHLPNVPVTEIIVYEEGFIRAATFGRGIWWTSSATDCPDAMTMGNEGLDGALHFEANQTITSENEIYHGLGTDVSFKAGESVTLLPGFHARSLAKFKAYIGPCGVGGLPE